MTTVKNDTISGVIFNKIPLVQTMDTSDDSDAIASTAFVNNTFNTLSSEYLTIDTDQMIEDQSIDKITSITSIDSILNSGAIDLGNINDTNVSINPTNSFSLGGYLQPLSSIWRFWAIGSNSPYSTSSTGTPVQCANVQCGKLTMTSSSQNILFESSFLTNPVILMGISSNINIQTNKWASNITTSGFTANVSEFYSGIEFNWMAIGR